MEGKQITPGPWPVSRSRTGNDSYCVGLGIPRIAVVKREADAVAISALPELLAAAQAVVDRWDTPQWKDAEPTAEFIGRLRAALAASRA